MTMACVASDLVLSSETESGGRCWGSISVGVSRAAVAALNRNVLEQFVVLCRGKRVQLEADKLFA